MKKITLSQIALACNGTLFCRNYQKEKSITGVTIDSRKIEKDCLFVALKGNNVDGHDFIEKALDDGALCAISEKKLEGDDICYILVNSCNTALMDIARFYRSLFDIPFIGISGSVGKTSTKEMIASVLSQKYKVHKTQGNFNNEIGMPLTILSMPEETQIAVIEMGISDFGEMDRLASVVKPDLCILTIIGSSHLEKLMSRRGVLKAKTEMFNHINENGKILLNGDDNLLNTITDVNGIKPYFYGLLRKNDYTAVDITYKGLKGIECTLMCGDDEIYADIPSIGEYSILNALCAFAVGKIYNVSDIDIAKGIRKFKTIKGRTNIIKTKKHTIIDDCYNANPSSMSYAVDTLSTFNSTNRTVAILGDMLELGANEEDLHRQIGRRVNERNIQKLVCIGELAKYIVMGYNRENYIYFANVKDAKIYLKSILKPQDVILVKASNGMGFSEIVEYIKNDCPFEDDYYIV